MSKKGEISPLLKKILVLVALLILFIIVYLILKTRVIDPLFGAA